MSRTFVGLCETEKDLELSEINNNNTTIRRGSLGVPENDHIVGSLPCLFNCHKPGKSIISR